MGPIKNTFGYLGMGHNFIAVLVGVIIVILLMVIIGLTWSLLVLIGLILIGAALIIVIFDRGAYMDFIFIFTLSAGLAFIILHLLGVSLGIVDFSTVPALEALHNLFN